MTTGFVYIGSRLDVIHLQNHLESLEMIVVRICSYSIQQFLISIPAQQQFYSLNQSHIIFVEKDHYIA